MYAHVWVYVHVGCACAHVPLACVHTSIRGWETSSQVSQLVQEPCESQGHTELGRVGLWVARAQELAFPGLGGGDTQLLMPVTWASRKH